MMLLMSWPGAHAVTNIGVIFGAMMAEETSQQINTNIKTEAFSGLFMAYPGLAS